MEPAQLIAMALLVGGILLFFWSLMLERTANLRDLVVPVAGMIAGGALSMVGLVWLAYFVFRV